MYKNVIVALLLVYAALVYIHNNYIDLYDFFASGKLEKIFTSRDVAKPKKIQVVRNPQVTTYTLGNGEVSGDFTFFDLPGGLDGAKIHDIVFHNDVMWMGTDKGLVSIAGNAISVFRQFSDLPFEWVRGLVLTPYGLVVQTHVAHGNTGGKRTGIHLFNIDNQTWTRIGDNRLSQAWLDGYLYQASGILTRRDPQNNWQREKIPLQNSICRKVASTLKMRAINGELWLTGTGETVGFPSHSIGCGVLRFDPQTGAESFYDNHTGLNSNYGWDLAGDHKEVFVTHSVKHDRLSRYDVRQGKWEIMPKRGSGNSIYLKKNSLWLATSSPGHSLARISRYGYERTGLSGMPAGHSVSTVGFRGNEVWFGTYKTTWYEQSYTIKSRLGLYIDKPG